MGTRTIGLADDAYERLLALKQEGETFSDVVRRITGAPLLLKLAGTLDPQTARRCRAAIARKRKEEDAVKRARVKRMG